MALGLVGIFCVVVRVEKQAGQGFLSVVASLDFGRNAYKNE